MLCEISLQLATENHLVMVLGGTIKKLTIESLSKTKTAPIITALQAYQYCKTNMFTVKLFFLPKNNLAKVCLKLKTRYATGHTVPCFYSQKCWNNLL